MTQGVIAVIDFQSGVIAPFPTIIETHMVSTPDYAEGRN